ncbi:MAG: FAD-dependent oxidoreductase [Eubacteriaceae bacterium]|nr:FAD-dependent oxidoreductase [Eubacteriaceae bacterium]
MKPDKKNMYLLAAITIFLSLLLIFTGCSPEDSDSDPDGDNSDSYETDVLVVGSGAAGLAAAITAGQEGARVILMEKLPAVGGTAVLSSGMLYAAESPVQERQGITESAGDLYDFWMNASEGKADSELVKVIADLSGDTVRWFQEDIGVEYSIHDDYGPRMHFPDQEAGDIVERLKAKADDVGVKIILGTRAKKLILSQEGEVTGVEGENASGNKVTIQAEAVILATGGFERNEKLIDEYTPLAAEGITGVSQGNSGDGLVMAREAGAEIITHNSYVGSVNDEGKAVIMSTVGGPRIDSGAHVLDMEGEFIKGLYAAGSVANGQFFYKKYPDSGSSLVYCFTMGRIAGSNAAQEIKVP